jgi:hypothetical protein
VGKVDFERLAKAAAVTALLAYVLGLLATALYLEKLDVPLPDLAVLEPRFIYTGALAFACFAISGLLPFLVLALIGVVRTSLSDRGWYSRVATIAAMLAVAYVEWRAYGLILERDRASVTTANELTALWLTLSATGVGVCAVGLIAAARADRNRTLFAGFGTLSLIGLGIWFLNVFSGEILPRIPEQYGGLQPKRAQLLFADDAVADARAMGVAFVSASHLSSPVRVLYEGDNNYVLQLDQDRVVQLARHHVVGSITDSKLPTPRAIEERDREGNAVKRRQGAQIVLSYSEPIDPRSLLPGWRGSAADVVARFRGGDPDGITLAVLSGSGDTPVALGTIRFIRARLPDHDPRSVAARMVLEGNDVIITLDEELRLASYPTTLSWKPSPLATDVVGNAVLAREIRR